MSDLTEFTIPSLEELKNYDKESAEKLIEDITSKISEIEISNPFFYAAGINNLIWKAITHSQTNSELMRAIELKIKLFPLFFGKTKTEGEKESIQVSNNFKRFKMLSDYAKIIIEKFKMEQSE